MCDWCVPFYRLRLKEKPKRPEVEEGATHIAQRGNPRDCLYVSGMHNPQKSSDKRGAFVVEQFAAQAKEHPYRCGVEHQLEQMESERLRPGELIHQPVRKKIEWAVVIPTACQSRADGIGEVLQPKPRSCDSGITLNFETVNKNKRACESGSVQDKCNKNQNCRRNESVRP